MLRGVDYSKLNLLLAVFSFFPPKTLDHYLLKAEQMPGKTVRPLCRHLDSPLRGWLPTERQRRWCHALGGFLLLSGHGTRVAVKGPCPPDLRAPRPGSAGGCGLCGIQGEAWFK